MPLLLPEHWKWILTPSVLQYYKMKMYLSRRPNVSHRPELLPLRNDISDCHADLTHMSVPVFHSLLTLNDHIAGPAVGPRREAGSGYGAPGARRDEVTSNALRKGANVDSSRVRWAKHGSHIRVIDVSTECQRFMASRDRTQRRPSLA